MARRGEVNDAALLGLLWNPERPAAPRPGPKSQLTVKAIVDAGIAVADDRDGPALSMRLVSERLGCTPMALYSYVDGKDTLLRLMYDAAHAGFTPPARPAESPANPVQEVQGWAGALTDLYADHHWLADLSWSRPVLGPHEQTVLESLLQRLRPLTLAPSQEGTIASALLALCRHTGRLIADARHLERTSAESDEQWWQAQSTTMASLVPDFAERFPLSARIESAAPDEEPGGGPPGGYLERTARAQLRRTVRLLLCGAATTALSG
ncbi:MAG: TetR/AcrR family transcriptional regulator C-terminal domain-containing protein [Propionicimonas sp.]